MLESRRRRLLALLAGIAVIAAGLVPAVPAFAEDPPDAGAQGAAAATYPTSSPGDVTLSNASGAIQVTTASWPVGTTFTFVWQRGATATTATTTATGVATSTSTTSTYTPNAADWNQFLRVKATATVPGYSPTVRYSAARKYSILSSSTIAVSGTPKIGSQVTVDTSGLAYTDSDGFSIPTGALAISYQWLRNGVPITDTPAATSDAADDADYTLRGGDLNASVTLRVTAAKPGWVSRVLVTPVFKPTQAGTIQATSPTASISGANDAAAPMKVTLTASTAGVTEPELGTPSYQWYRVNRTTNAATLISGATGATYKPVAADLPYAMRVVVTVKKAGYANLPLTGNRDMAVRIDGYGLWINGTAKVGETLGVSSSGYSVVASNGVNQGLSYSTPGVTATFQWRRAGVNIPGATGSSYTLVPADAGKVISYSVRVEFGTGYLAYTGVSPNTSAVAPTTFTSGGPPVVTHNGLTLSVAPHVTDINPNADSFKIQWYRNGVAIAGKTGTSYTLVGTDYGKQIVPKITYYKVGYTPQTVAGDDGAPDLVHEGKWWIAASPALPTFSGDVKVGQTLTVGPRTYTKAIDDSALSVGLSVIVTYQWLRSGVAIPGATASTYTIGTLDKGKTISVRVTAADPLTPHQLLSSVTTSVASSVIGTQSLPGAYPLPVAPSLVVQPTSTPTSLVLGVSATGITSPSGTVPNAIAYQWYRGATAIAGATKATYALTQADRGFEVRVRVITSHAAIGTTTYTPVVLYSEAHDYTLTGSTAEIHVYTDLSVGSEVAPQVPPYTDAAGAPVAGWTQSFQWYRTVGKKTTAIPGAITSYYFLQAGDVGATISVRVITGKVGYNPYVVTYKTPVPTQKVVKGTLINTGNPAPSVYADNDAGRLIAVPPDVTGQPLFPSSTTQHATFTYQWYRGATKITGATKQTYQLTTADAPYLIHVVATANLAGYTSLILTASDPIDYRLQEYTAQPPNMKVGDPWRVGTTVHVENLNFVDHATAHLQSPNAISYQWLRTLAGKTTVVATTTVPEYSLVAADLNAKITARLTVTKANYAPLVYTTPAISQVVLKGQDTNSWYPVVQANGFGALTAAISDLSPGAPAPVLTYKWLRNGSIISGATAKNYTLTAADADKDISVRVTMSRPGFEPLVQPTKDSTAAKHTIYTDATTQPTISGSAAVGVALHSSTPDFFTNSAHTGFLDSSGTYFFTWYRSGVVISGATASSYTLTAADLNKTISVRVTAKAPGMLAAVSQVSASTGPVVLGTIDPGTYAPVTSMSLPATHKLSVTFTGTPGTTGTTATYKWSRTLPYHTPVFISGATASSYTMPTSDSSTQAYYYVSVTLTKPGYNPYTYAGVYPPYGLQANAFGLGTPHITGSYTVGGTLTCNPPTFTTAWGEPLVPGTNGSLAYAWWDESQTVLATTQTYSPLPSDVGTAIKCVVFPKAAYHSFALVGSPSDGMTIS